MEYYICRPITELPGYMQIKFRVQEGMVLNAGQIYVGENLDTKIGNQNYDTFIPEEISDTAKQIPSILINNEFEQIPDGRRPDGQPDYTQYYFTEGEVVTAISLLPETKYELSYDSIIAESEIKVGGILYPEEGNSKLMYADSLYGVNSKTYLLIENLKYFRLGGEFGSQFINTMVVRVKQQKGNGEEKLNITTEIVPNLVVPVDAGTVVGKITVAGGESPYTYELVNGGKDNSLFDINDGKEITITPRAELSEARIYEIMIGVTDKDGYKAMTTLNIMVDSPAITDINLTMTKDIRQGETSTQPNGLIATVTVTGGTEPYTLSLNGTNASSFIVDKMAIRTGAEALTQGTYNIKVIATDSKEKTLSKDVEIEVLQPYPDIDSVTLNIEEGLQAPVEANTIVGHIQVLGGTAPYTITLPAGVKDNDLFAIEDAIKTKSAITSGGVKNITVRVVDAHNKEKEASAVINIDYPEITSVTVKPVSGLKAPVAVDTKIADITSIGGTTPITYSLPAGISNNDSFKISGTQVQAKVEIADAGSYAVVVKAADNKGKTKNSVTTAFTIAATE